MARESKREKSVSRARALWGKELSILVRPKKMESDSTFAMSYFGHVHVSNNVSYQKNGQSYHLRGPSQYDT